MLNNSARKGGSSLNSAPAAPLPRREALVRCVLIRRQCPKNFELPAFQVGPTVSSQPLGERLQLHHVARHHGDDDWNARSCLARTPRSHLRDSGEVSGAIDAPWYLFGLYAQSRQDRPTGAYCQRLAARRHVKGCGKRGEPYAPGYDLSPGGETRISTVPAAAASWLGLRVGQIPFRRILLAIQCSERMVDIPDSTSWFLGAPLAPRTNLSRTYTRDATYPRSA